MRFVPLLAITSVVTITGYSQVQTTVKKVTTPTNISSVARQKEAPDDKAMKMTDQAKLEAIEKNVYELTNTVTSLQAKLETTTNKLNNTQSKLTEAEGKLKALENKLASGEGKPTVFQVTVNGDNI